MKKHLLLIIISSLTSISFCYAQGVAVNTTGTAADASAMLDVSATNKGILIPRVTSTASITSPVTGLLIFQTTAPVGFYYYDGATWDYLQNSANANVTLQGNTFNTANKLLMLDGSGKVPLANLGTSGTPSASTYLNGNDTWVSVPAGMANGTAAGQVYLTGSSPFAAQNPQTVTGDVTISSTAVTSYNNVVPTNKGGAGAVNGILTANGAGTVTSASTTGSGSVVLATSPTLITPALGTPIALVGTNISGTAANLTAGNVTTDANLTGAVTSIGNATSYNTIVPIAKGGTGTATPALVAGSNVTITGAWPNQTIAATSGASATALTLTSSLLNLGNSANLYFTPNGGSILASHTATTYTGVNNGGDADNFTVPFACTISSLSVASNTIYTGTGADVTTFTVYKNGAATSMTCTVNNTTTVGSLSSASDATHTFTVVAGDRISILFQETDNNGLSAPYISYGVVLRTQ